MTDPLRFELGNNPKAITFSVENYYDASLGRLLVRRKGSVQTDTAFIEECPFGDSYAPGQLIVYYPAGKPGEYELELMKRNGRRAAFSQPLIVSKGAPLVYGMKTFISAGAQYAMSGANLYEEDKLELLIRQKSGYAARVKPVRFDEAVGVQFVYFNLPDGIEPGYYFAQVIRNNQEYPAFPYGAIILTPKRETPFVTTNFIDVPHDPEPFVARRNVKIETGIGTSGLPALDVGVQFVCREVNNPQHMVIAGVTLPSGYWQGWTEGTGAYFVFPPTMKPGTYQLTPRFVLKGGKVIEGLLFPRSWIVQ